MNIQQVQQVLQIVAISGGLMGAIIMFVIGVQWGQHGKVSGLIQEVGSNKEFHNQQISVLTKTLDDHKAAITGSFNQVASKLDQIGQDVAVLKDRDTRSSVPKA